MLQLRAVPRRAVPCRPATVVVPGRAGTPGRGVGPGTAGHVGPCQLGTTANGPCRAWAGHSTAVPGPAHVPPAHLVVYSSGGGHSGCGAHQLLPALLQYLLLQWPPKQRALDCGN
uniref:Uncharacterized protein n=1 Tax=Oryza sativa subsp. japonica TaxID=39947 RepID=Q6K5F7_ORYSJ|nr:hypothetical protein [Oryza sativa Japonica Group]BAD22168.1 hypothetical protein [Oryza sativa Japonica Group]